MYVTVFQVSASEYLGQYLIDHSEKGYSTKTGAGKASIKERPFIDILGFSEY